MYVCVSNPAVLWLTERGLFDLAALCAGSMQQMQQMDEEKKGLWKTLMERFSSKAPEEEKASDK